MELPHFTQSILVGAASMRGPGHVRENLPNQDAFAYFASPTIAAVAVADGLGSRPHSSEGAKWAVSTAVLLAVEYLLQGGEGLMLPSSRLGELKFRMLQTWRTRFGDLANDYACTLALVAFARDRCLMGQIGDSQIWYVPKELPFSTKVFYAPDKEFLNLTHALSDRDALATFRLEEFMSPVEKAFRAFYVMSDGVADDVEDRDAFIQSTLNHLTKTEAGHWNLHLENVLKTWATPAHYDDKTLVVVTLGPPVGGGSAAPLLKASVPLEAPVRTGNVSGQVGGDFESGHPAEPPTQQADIAPLGAPDEPGPQRLALP